MISSCIRLDAVHTASAPVPSIGCRSVSRRVPSPDQAATLSPLLQFLIRSRLVPLLLLSFDGGRPVLLLLSFPRSGTDLRRCGSCPSMGCRPGCVAVAPVSRSRADEYVSPRPPVPSTIIIIPQFFGLIFGPKTSIKSD